MSSVTVIMNLEAK